MKKLIVSFLIVFSQMAIAGNCEVIFDMTIKGHKRDEKYKMEYCEEKEKSLKVSYNTGSKIIGKKFVDEVLRNLQKLDPESSVEKLVENCKNTKRKKINAVLNLPGKDKAKVCFFDRSTTLYHYRNYVEEVFYSEYYK